MTEPIRYRIVHVEPPVPDGDTEPPLVRRTFTLQHHDGPIGRTVRVTLSADHQDLSLLHYYADTGAALELKAGWLPPDLRVVPATPA